MSLTKPLNSKVNMKQYSDADLPLNPKQPAVARYAAESTLNQTVINLPFQVDTVNAADSFILSVDGKVLTPGSLNDYQFTAVDSFGFSNTITLNYALAAGLNIQGIKLGLKKETEFLQDARFTALYEGIDQGLQGFVRTSDLMVATSTTGAPGSGLFYSSIVNRASMPDLRTDLKARMGIERLQVQAITQLQNEFGPNGEAVWSAVNDTLGQIRFVGQNWVNTTNAQGSSPLISSGLANGTDYIEVTFYGTGLNLLLQLGTYTTLDVRIQTDGGTESANIIPASASGVTNNRNYSNNTVLPVVSGLSLGVHTTRIRVVANSGIGIQFPGFEILNEVSTIKVNPGSSYLAGKKITTIAQQSLVYNTTFESGILGTRGGRVVVYQKADGSIGKAVQPVDSIQANLISANHQNEEISRTHYIREFGAGRADDFSVSGQLARAFTLDDGTTTLVTNLSIITSRDGIEGLILIGNGATNHITFTFVGTGLDLVCSTDSNTRSIPTVSVNGTNIGSISIPANTKNNQTKLVSGLPYGTHTVRLQTTSAADAPSISRFVVYSPKKPSIPAGAVELADYNVMANYVASTISSYAGGQFSTGVIAKMNTRELTYVGAGVAITSVNAAFESGFRIDLVSTNDTVQYTFFGTGFELSLQANVTGVAGQLYVDGVLYTGAATLAPTTNATWTPGTSTVAWTAAIANVLQVTGLSLGTHTVKLVKSNATGALLVDAVNVITPIHSTKTNLYGDLQNTLPVGSNAISDNRKTTIVKDLLPAQKAWAQATGITSSPTTTSTSMVPMPDMSLTIRTNGGALFISYSVPLLNGTIAQNLNTQVYVNGIAVGGPLSPNAAVANSQSVTSYSIIVAIPPGTHKVDVYWSTTGGTMTSFSTGRILNVREL